MSMRYSLPLGPGRWTAVGLFSGADGSHRAPRRGGDFGRRFVLDGPMLERVGDGRTSRAWRLALIDDVGPSRDGWPRGRPAEPVERLLPVAACVDGMDQTDPVQGPPSVVALPAGMPHRETPMLSQTRRAAGGRTTSLLKPAALGLVLVAGAAGPLGYALHAADRRQAQEVWEALKAAADANPPLYDQ
jgi:hypothetical protein